MNTLQHTQTVISVDIFPPTENRSNVLFAQRVSDAVTWDDIYSESYVVLQLRYANTSSISEHDWRSIIFEDRDQMNIQTNRFGSTTVTLSSFVR